MINQLDGNVSLLSSDSENSTTIVETNDLKQSCPLESPPAWYEPYCPRKNIAPIRKTIYRNNKLFVSQHLPSISVSNVRSLIPKINNFKLDVQEREISVALLSEIWEKCGKKRFKKEVVKMKELNGLGYISTSETLAGEVEAVRLLLILTCSRLKKLMCQFQNP